MSLKLFIAPELRRREREPEVPQEMKLLLILTMSGGGFCGGIFCFHFPAQHNTHVVCNFIIFIDSIINYTLSPHHAQFIPTDKQFFS